MEVCLILSHQFNDYQCILYQFTIRSRFFPQVGDLLVASQALQLDVIHIHQGSHGQRLLFANSTTLFLEHRDKSLESYYLHLVNAGLKIKTVPFTVQGYLPDSPRGPQSFAFGHFLIDTLPLLYCMSEACLINNTLSHLPLFLYQIDSWMSDLLDHYSPLFSINVSNCFPLSNCVPVAPQVSIARYSASFYPVAIHSRSLTTVRRSLHNRMCEGHHYDTRGSFYSISFPPWSCPSS